MKKRFVAAALAVLVTFSCASCAAESESSEEESSQGFTAKLDAEEEATVNIIGNMSNFEALEAVITDFEEYYPNCDILYTPLTDNNEYFDVLESRLRSDESVGIFMISSSEYEESEYIQEASVNLLEEDIDLSAIQDEVISSSTIDGKLYQIPLMHNSAGLIVNKTLLENEGVEIPTNYSEFLEACKTLKEAGYVPVQGNRDSVDKNLMRSMSYVIMNNKFNSSSSEVSLASLEAGEENSAAFLQPIFDVINTLLENGYMDAELNIKYSDGYNDSILKFFEGDVPFLVGTTETLSGMKKRETKSEYFTSYPFDYAFITTPFGEDSAYCYLENWYGFSVNKNCTEKEWAIEFMRFITTNEEINKIAYTKGLPSVAKETDDDRFIGLYSGNEEYRCTIDTSFPSNVQLALYFAEDDFINGKITADKATSEIERRIRENDLTD